jgi:hypothetical protein
MFLFSIMDLDPWSVPGTYWCDLSVNFITSLPTYEGVSKSFRTDRLEQELQMVQLSATGCSCVCILWVSLVSFATITLCVASQRVFIVVYFVTDSVRKLLDTASYLFFLNCILIIRFIFIFHSSNAIILVVPYISYPVLQFVSHIWPFSVLLSIIISQKRRRSPKCAYL